MQIKTLGALLLMAMATMASANTVNCPVSTIEPPAITATGPYHIEGWGTTSATATGLPNCMAVEALTATMLAGIAPETAGVVVEVDEDGTYTVALVP